MSKVSDNAKEYASEKAKCDRCGKTWCKSKALICIDYEVPKEHFLAGEMKGIGMAMEWFKNNWFNYVSYLDDMPVFSGWEDDFYKELTKDEKV